MSTLPSEPRVAHYLYAHRAVPRAFLRDPAAIMGILLSDDGMKFLSGMWDVLDQELAPDERINHEALALERYDLGAGVCVSLVTMPTPKRRFEAYFVALAAGLEDRVFARAFTLDLAGPPGPRADAGILEWDTEGNHTFIDPALRMDAAAFVAALEGILKEDAKDGA